MIFIESSRKVKIVETLCDDPFQTKKHKQGQSLVPLSGIAGISLTKILDRDLRDIVERSYILGCCYAADGSILIADRENCRVIVLKEDGSFIQEIKLKDTPNKIVFIKGNIYVSSYTGKTLAWIDFATGKIIKTKKFEHNCDALALADERLIINILHKEYKILDLNLEFIGYIPIQKLLTHHLSYLNGKLYFADETRIYCYDMTGQVQWIQQDKRLPRSSGCSVDSRGNVFAASWTENNIVVVSPDGQNWKIVAQLENMKRATALHYDRRRGRILVISEISPRVQEFEVQY